MAEQPNDASRKSKAKASVDDERIARAQARIAEVIRPLVDGKE